MAADSAKLVARQDEFPDAVGKYNVKERGGVRISVRVIVRARVRLGVGVANIIKRCVECNT